MQLPLSQPPAAPPDAARRSRPQSASPIGRRAPSTKRSTNRLAAHRHLASTDTSSRILQFTAPASIRASGRCRRRCVARYGSTRGRTLQRRASKRAPADSRQCSSSRASSFCNVLHLRCDRATNLVARWPQLTSLLCPQRIAKPDRASREPRLVTAVGVELSSQTTLRREKNDAEPIASALEKIGKSVRCGRAEDARPIRRGAARISSSSGAAALSTASIPASRIDDR